MKRHYRLVRTDDYLRCACGFKVSTLEGLMGVSQARQEEVEAHDYQKHNEKN